MLAPVLAAAVLAAAAAVVPPQGERITVEAAVASEVLYPPVHKDPWSNPGYGVSLFGSWHHRSRFKAMVGLGFEHVVGAWLGDPEARPPSSGPDAGRVPANARGQLMRLSPQVRLGLESGFAYGYFGLSPGYALRVAAMRCETAACGRAGTHVGHGLDLGISIGALLRPFEQVGFVTGAEVGLDWARFFGGPPTLARWTHAMSARLSVGWMF